ncbi:type II toxin-antitoxin system VapC family toxin [Candidatus Micrarchaeota archaeon]|nr:type II toxin-antitoxin system VapC family toxin [Candidatus Micrarchaeota archaeon]
MLPQVHIDSSIFLEIILKQREKERCEDWLSKMGRTHRGVISTSVMGEIVKNIFYWEGDAEERQIMHEWFFKELKKLKIRVFSPDMETLQKVAEIKDVDSRIQGMDALHYACSVRDGAQAFLCKDIDFDKSLEKTFGVSIIQVIKR